MTENIIFIHIPKTAGFTIGRCLRDIDVLQPGYGFSHEIARNIVKEKDKHLPIMAVVRNPYDRLYSMYEYYTKIDRKIPQGVSFQEFILKFETDYYLHYREFDTCYNFVADHNHQLIPTDVLYFENLHAEYDAFCKKYNIANNLIYRNVNHLKNTHIDWTKLYTLEMRKIVETVFKMDFVTFNYTYEDFIQSKLVKSTM